MSGSQDDAGNEPESSAPGAADQADLLREMRGLRRDARAARHAYWFPLALFGLLVGASAPFYVRPAPQTGISASFSNPPLPVFSAFPDSGLRWYLGYYWLVALAVGLLLTLVWYRWNARRVGLKTPARGFVVTAAALTALAVAIPPLSRVHSPHWLGWLSALQVLLPGDLMIRGTFPLLVIAVSLWVLAWAERSPALAVIAACFSAVALTSSLYNVENILFRLGWTPEGNDWRLTSLPNVLLPALVLLAAGTGAFAVQRRRQARA